MRAFMSDKSSRDGWAATWPRGTWTHGTLRASLEAMAEREAQRLLAETEPVNPGGLRMCAHIHLSWRDPMDVTASALADALRAFVAD